MYICMIYMYAYIYEIYIYEIYIYMIYVYIYIYDRDIYDIYIYLYMLAASPPQVHLCELLRLLMCQGTDIKPSFNHTPDFYTMCSV